MSLMNDGHRRIIIVDAFFPFPRRTTFKLQNLSVPRPGSTSTPRKNSNVQKFKTSREGEVP
jgi:hypothetical protein